MIYNNPPEGHERPFVKVTDFDLLINHSERFQRWSNRDEFKKIFWRICIATNHEAYFTMSPEELIYCLTGDNSVFADSAPRAVGNEKR
jgi:hypothetical protein